MTSLQTVRGSARRSTPTRTRSLALMTAIFLIAASAPFSVVPAQDLVLEDEGPTVSLSLHDALGMAMDNNLDIAVQRFDIDINTESIDIQRALYEGTFQSTYYEDEINNQNANPFAGFPVVTQKSRQLTANWNDPTKWGGNFNVFFRQDKVKSNFLLLRPQYSSNLNLTYQQSLLRGLGMKINEAPIVIAQNSSRIADWQFRDGVQNTVELTEFAYWNLVFARLDLGVQRQSLSLAEDLLAMNKAKVEVGTMAPIDVTQAEAGVADRVEGVIVAQASVRNAEDSLRQLMNPPPDSPYWQSAILPVDAPEFRPLEPDVLAAIDAARDNRPDLEQQRLRVRSNALQEEIDKKAKRWDLVLEGRYNLEGLAGTLTQCQATVVNPNPPPPNLDLSSPITNPAQRDQCINGTLLGNQAVPIAGQIVATSDQGLTDSLSELNNTEFADWRLQATLTIPLGNKDRKARYAQSMLRHRQSQAQMKNLNLAAEIDVRAKVRDVTTNIQRVKAATKNRELQQANVDAEQKKFENGMSTSFLVLQAQDALRSAERRQNLAIIEYNKSLVSLEKSKGTLLEARNIEVAKTGGWAPHPSEITTDLRGIIGQ